MQEKSHFSDILADDAVFYASLVLLVALTAFGLGRLSQEINLETTPNGGVELTAQPAAVVESGALATPETGQFVASKQGSKFHRLDCPGAGQIAEKNKLYFRSEAEAMSAGYSRAANCAFAE